MTTALGPSVVPVEEGRQTTASVCELYREAIELGLSQGRNAMGIWQDLVDSFGFDGGYAGVKRFVRKLRGTQSPEARVIRLWYYSRVRTSSWQLIATYLTSVLSAKLLCSGAVVCIMLKHCARVNQRSGGSRVVAMLSSPQARSGKRYQEAT
jgi:hypothetical protein